MTEVVKSRKVTFAESLPNGTVGTFTHDGQVWFAYPQSKVQEIAGAHNRAVAVIERLHEDLLRWVNDHPEDAARVTHMMARTVRFKELAAQKGQAWTIRERADEKSTEEPTGEEGPEDAEGGDTAAAATGP